MKKTFVCLLTLLILAGFLTACSGAGSNTMSDKLSIVCTIFPEYDWVKQILGNHAAEAELTLLLDSGVDLHSYQPTADDIIRISTCDVFVYVGGESDSWVDGVLSSVKNNSITAVKLLDVLGDRIKEEEVKEGMEAEETAEDEPEYDEHIWLSLKNAITLCNHLSDVLCTADSDHAADYRSNTAAYVAQLTDLDMQYRQTVDTAKRKTLLFGDRFPFRYLTDDYGLDYFAAFVGCSAETEASFETVAFLAGKADELDLPCVITIEGTDHRLAETIIESTKNKQQTILSLNSLQSATSHDAADGVTYLSVMENNLGVLRTALN